jgi:hypothetical protein
VQEKETIKDYGLILVMFSCIILPPSIENHHWVSHIIKTLEDNGFEIQNNVMFNATALLQTLYQGEIRSILIWNADSPHLDQVSGCLQSDNDIILLYAQTGDILPCYDYHDMFVPSNLPVMERNILYQHYFTDIEPYNTFYNYFNGTSDMLRLIRHNISDDEKYWNWNWNLFCPCIEVIYSWLA